QKPSQSRQRKKPLRQRQNQESKNPGRQSRALCHHPLQCLSMAVCNLWHHLHSKHLLNPSQNQLRRKPNQPQPPSLKAVAPQVAAMTATSSSNGAAAARRRKRNDG